MTFIDDLYVSSVEEVNEAMTGRKRAAFPRTPGIEESYAVTVKAKDFIDHILVDKNGRLRQRIFEQHVRDFLGMEGDVNKEMAETIAAPLKQKRFGIPNNGITMISPDVKVAGLEIFTRDFQIVIDVKTKALDFRVASLPN
jgi:AIPR protein